jgi:4-amino-4-deoxychorismate lyase
VIVVLPERGVLPATTPLLRADDAGVQYGDGVFETVHVRAGVPWLLDAHVERMERSAALLELPLPPRAALADLALAAAARHPAAEGALRLVCTRGTPDTGPTWYATVDAVPAPAVRQRRDGVRALTASLGATVHGRPPWLLTGAKSVSYAANLAARRWAGAHGADELIWTSVEGYVLEAPTANVAWLDGTTLCTVPAADTGILAGTTVAELHANARHLGLAARERLVTLAELAGADAVWLTSALRGVAEVRVLDGAARPASPWTRRLLDVLGYPTPA